MRPRGGRRHHGARRPHGGGHRGGGARGAGTPPHAGQRGAGGAGVRRRGPPVVVLDPIDGSVNAIRGLPIFAPRSRWRTGRTMGDVVLGLVRDHGTGEEFTAERGRGARLGGRPIGPPRAGRRADGAPAARGRRPGPGRRRRAGRSTDTSAACARWDRWPCRCATSRPVAREAMAGLGSGRPVDVAAAQLVAHEAGMAVGLPRPCRSPRGAARRDDPLPRAGRPRPRDPRAPARRPRLGTGTRRASSVLLTVSPGFGPPSAW